MKELLTYIVQSLVDHPDEVSVTERKADGETVFEVRVADGDMGKVIGRHPGLMMYLSFGHHHKMGSPSLYQGKIPLE